MLFITVVLYTKQLLIAIWTCLLELFSFMTVYFSILSMLDISYHTMMQSIVIGYLDWWRHTVRRAKFPVFTSVRNNIVREVGASIWDGD